ncbi:hypothetical protein BJX68DRAFT_54000 [Aspergillus pseudodeflectus]|uniref:Uncharacterized protein n=1 Tax=Aspergillus pseudodeflectus TaxID=176178 RepID=A0ABR4KMS5_9EURO
MPRACVEEESGRAQSLVPGASEWFWTNPRSLREITRGVWSNHSVAQPQARTTSNQRRQRRSHQCRPSFDPSSGLVEVQITLVELRRLIIEAADARESRKLGQSDSNRQRRCNSPALCPRPGLLISCLIRRLSRFSPRSIFAACKPGCCSAIANGLLGGLWRSSNRLSCDSGDSGERSIINCTSLRTCCATEGLIWGPVKANICRAVTQRHAVSSTVGTA